MADKTRQDPMLKRSDDMAHMMHYWEKADTVIDGIEAMRCKREKMLPRFTDETTAEYDFRLSTTKMTNVYHDTLESLAAKPFEEDVCLVNDDDISPPEMLKEFAENVDGAGSNLTAFANQVFFNGINAAISWIMIDYPDTSALTGMPVSVADARSMSIAPYWSIVLACNVIDVQSVMVMGAEVLSRFKIYEPGKPDHIREFVRADDGTVTWKLYEDKGKIVDEKTGTQFAEVSSGTVSIGRIPLVPFMTGRRNGRSWRFYPPMKAALELQVELYQQESALKFAKTLTAYPMLAANGVNPPKEADNSVKNVKVGPGRVLYAPFDASGKAGSWAYVEPNSESLKFLAQDIKDAIDQLRELGRQPLTAQSGNLTSITTGMAASKARTVIKQWALTLQNALENAFVMTLLYTSEDVGGYDPSVYVFSEFDAFIDGKDLDALQADVLANRISLLTYWDEMQRRGVYGPDFTAEREQKRLLDGLPSDNAPDMVDPVEEPLTSELNLP